MYTAAIKGQGFGKLRFLRDAEEEDIDELAKDIEMKKPHFRTFKRAWQKLVAADADENVIKTDPSV